MLLSSVVLELYNYVDASVTVVSFVDSVIRLPFVYKVEYFPMWGVCNQKFQKKCRNERH